MEPDEYDGEYDDAHELDAENAWLHHAEREDPEAQADLELHLSLYPDGYGR